MTTQREAIASELLWSKCPLIPEEVAVALLAEIIADRRRGLAAAAVTLGDEAPGVTAESAMPVAGCCGGADAARGSLDLS